MTATVPSQPSAPTTTLNGDQTLVTIDWSLPSDLGGLSIGGYKVEIKTSTGTFEKETGSCDAETDSSIIQASSCQISVSTLRASPFNLADSSSVIAIVTAFNDIGSSVTSAEGNGATIPTL